jgi:hypothetical protein
LTYSASLDAASVKGAGKIRDSGSAVQHRPGSFKDGQTRPMAALNRSGIVPTICLIYDSQSGNLGKVHGVV